MNFLLEILSLSRRRAQETPKVFAFEAGWDIEGNLRCNYINDDALMGTAVEVTLSLGAEFDEPCNAGKKSVIRADADVPARHDFGAALAHDYFAHAHFLAIGALDAEVLRIGIVQVFSCSGGFGCCHT